MAGFKLIMNDIALNLRHDYIFSHVYHLRIESGGFCHLCVIFSYSVIFENEKNINMS